MSTELFLENNDKNMLIVIAVVIFVLLSDTMINQVADFLAPQLVSNFGVALFVVFAIIFGITQYLVLRYTRKKIAYMYSKSKSTRIIHRIVSSIQYILLGIVLILVAQILISSSYSTYILVALTSSKRFT